MHLAAALFRCFRRLCFRAALGSCVRCAALGSILDGQGSCTRQLCSFAALGSWALDGCTRQLSLAGMHSAAIIFSCVKAALGSYVSPAALSSSYL